MLLPALNRIIYKYELQHTQKFGKKHKQKAHFPIQSQAIFGCPGLDLFSFFKRRRNPHPHSKMSSCSNQVVGALALSWGVKGGSWRRWYLQPLFDLYFWRSTNPSKQRKFPSKTRGPIWVIPVIPTLPSNNHGSGEWGPSSRRSFPSKFRRLSLNHDYGTKGGCWFQRCFFMFYPLEKIIQVDLCIVFSDGVEKTNNWIHEYILLGIELNIGQM